MVMTGSSGSPFFFAILLASLENFSYLCPVKLKHNIMEIFIGMAIFIVLVIGFMVINDIGERNPIEKVREELGEKILKEEEENQP
jgi:amino acid permease